MGRGTKIGCPRQIGGVDPKSDSELSRMKGALVVPNPSPCMSFPRKWESCCLFSGFLLTQEGHGGAVQRSLDCRLRGKDTKGHTQRSLDSCLRGKDTVAPSPGPAFGIASGQAGLSRQGRGRLDSRLRGNDISPPQTANVPLPSGRGSIPLTWLSQRLSRPLPGWGEAGKKKPRDSPSA